MNREIKFRVWDNVDYMSSPFTLKDIQDKKIQFTSDYIIMQFTGLTDKNGKDIYEGDIVEWGDNSYGKWRRRCCIEWVKSNYRLYGFYYDVSSPEIKASIEFRFGSFIYEADGELEIIGNIHETPSFLTK